MAKRPPDPARRLATAIARLSEERHCTEVLVLDVRGISPVTDYFVICTGTSDRQMRSVADEVVELAVARKQPLYSAAGIQSGGWILLDFIDLVVHVFDQERRHYYDLELIWGDAPRVRWRRRRSRTSVES